MSRFGTLYRKELKFLTKPFMVIVTIHVMAVIYLMTMTVPEYGDSWSFNSYVETVREHFAFLDVFMYGSILLIPFLLGYSWYEEWSNRTSLQLLTIPAGRAAVAWSKYLAAVTIGLWIPVGIVVYRYLYGLKVHPAIGLFPEPFAMHAGFAVFILGVIVWLTAVLSVAAEVMTMTRRYKRAVGTVVCVGLTFTGWAVMQLVTVQGREAIPETAFQTASFPVTGSIVMLTGSGLILVIGHLLFERFGEI